MIVSKLRIFSQNVRKNSLILNTILETQSHFNIILIQEPPWSEIRKIPSSSNCEGEPLVGTCHHPNWIFYARLSPISDEFPRVIAFINIRFLSLQFLFRKDIFDHHGICFLSFFNNGVCYYIINVYSDSSHSALKYLKDTEVNISNVLLMTGDFNIRDSLWDLTFPFHSSISDDLIMIVDSFDLSLSTPTNPGPMRFSDTIGESNLVINLMFLRHRSVELDNHSILPDCRLSSDHAPLIIDIPIVDEFIPTSKFAIPPNSEYKTNFIKDVISNFSKLDTSHIENINNLESTVDQMWDKNAKKSRYSKHSKQWWSESCRSTLLAYRMERSRENWKSFKSAVKNAKRSFFDNKIQEITNKSHGPWELMNWVKKRKLPAIEAIKYNDQPCLTPESLWNALHNTFNTALHHQVNVEILNEIDQKPSQNWGSFSSFEFLSAISRCADSSLPGPDRLTWCHWKNIIKNDTCLLNIINIANACINLGHWPNHFKISTTIIIPKPNKPSYDNPKAFQPIVLLNTLGKLIKKVIAE